MIFIKRYFRIVSLLLVVVSFLSAGCSYISDSIEGAISNRASFSIEASYSSPNVTVTWDVDNSDENFAGYELYITTEVNNEFSGYELAKSRYQPSTDLLMYSSSIGSIDYNVLSLDAGRYFFRLGVIHWDDDVSDRTTENGYNITAGTVDEWDAADDIEPNYNAKTKIDAISGLVAVDID